jgi:RND family efflux transporter MFP subunit
MTAAVPRFRGVGIGLGAAIVLGALAVLALHLVRNHRLAADADRRRRDLDAGPRVFVTPVRAAPGGRELKLPAEVRAFLQSTMYAKIAGYVKSISVDKGDRVRRGQLLGVLESPEVDQQVAAAASDLAIKRRTFERYQRLVGKDYVSKQDYDTVRSQYEVARATLRQVRALQKYQVLRAPFDGIVTARYVDPGALVPAATGSTASALPLVDVADLRRLRVTLFVQQDAAPFVRVGDPVTLADDQRPEVVFQAEISRIAKSLDPRSRSMLCEAWVENRDDQLYPGTFVHATLHLRAPTLPVVPSTALLTRDDRSMVAVVRNARVRLVPVETGVDDGRQVQIRSGVQAGEMVALNLPSEVGDGAAVRALPAKPAPGTAASNEAPPPAGAGPRQGRGGRTPRPAGE